MDKFKEANDAYMAASRLRSRLFAVRAAVCPHPESARTIVGPRPWSSWPDSGTDPGFIRCEDCNTVISDRYFGSDERTGIKTYPEEE